MLKGSGFAADEQGTVALEYALISSLIAIVVIITLGAAGQALGDVYTLVQTTLAGTAPSGSDSN